jgi:hypothetical protein
LILGDHLEVGVIGSWGQQREMRAALRVIDATSRSLSQDRCYDDL